MCSKQVHSLAYGTHDSGNFLMLVREERLTRLGGRRCRFVVNEDRFTSLLASKDHLVERKFGIVEEMAGHGNVVILNPSWRSVM